MKRRPLLAALGAALLLPAVGGAASAPETTITVGPAPLENTASASFSFTSSDPQARFACSLDSEPFADCTSPYEVSVDDGEHHFYVFAVVGGETDPTPAVWTWTADTIAPAAVKAHVSVRYGRFTLSWGSLDAFGASTVVIYRSTKEKQPAAQEIYRGGAGAYVDARFRNGTFHRYRAVAVDAAGNESRPVQFVIGPDALLISPKEGARLGMPLHLRWRQAPKATYYNVQLFRDGRKVLSAWPRTARMTVEKNWRYKGQTYRLTPGRYTWYVWPGFGRLVLGRYGQTLGQSSFSVR